MLDLDEGSIHMLGNRNGLSSLGGQGDALFWQDGTGEGRAAKVTTRVVRLS